MVPRRSPIKRARAAVPVLGVLALAALFLKLPEAPDLFGVSGCETCSANGPYLPLIGAGYFAALVAVALLFPAFPSPLVARGGLTWSVLLGLVLTYLELPAWCALCLVAHGCHVLIWTIWLAVPATADEPGAAPLRERLCLALFAPVAVVALFGCLNLTFMAYGFKPDATAAATSLKPGDAVPAFTTRTTGGRSIASADAARTAGVVLNFISPSCPHCKQQLPVLDAVATRLARTSYRFVNISPSLPRDLVRQSPATEWVEDKGERLRKLFDVSGYPTLFVVGNDGRIAQVIPGVPEQLEAVLLASLVKPRGG